MKAEADSVPDGNEELQPCATILQKLMVLQDGGNHAQNHPSAAPFLHPADPVKLGIPDYLVFRQPFPGPGLGIRIIGDVTAEKVQMVQDADAIWREEIAKAGLDKEVNQYFAALTNMRSVGVMGDFRTYDYAIALRAVNTSDFMTADAAQLPWEVLGKVTNRIVNEVKGVNRVMYDCTGKPPATIEFE